MGEPRIYKVKAIGRLGNLLYALCNAIKVSKANFGRIEIEKNKKNSIFKILHLDYSKSSNLTYSDFPAQNFFNKSKVAKVFGKDCIASLKESSFFLRSEVKPLLKLTKVSPRHDVVIHIRSGDLFDFEKFPLSRRAEWDHIQPPFSFYKKVILDHGFSHPLIVTEPDFKNPVISLLQQEFPSISVQSKSIEEDFSTLVQAPNLILSNSSFSFMAALASDTVSKVFLPDFCFGVPTSLKHSLFDPFVPEDFIFDFILYNCEDYYKVIEHYKKPEMIRVMKEFPISSVNRVDYSPQERVRSVDNFIDFGIKLSQSKHFKS
tara:strand:- start:1617 stop:2570 length:954 start_codon:yes stop_codon:yes gene_type:complete